MMPIELREADYLAIKAAIAPFNVNIKDWPEACYRAGIAAGLERAAKSLENRSPDGDYCPCAYCDAARKDAAAIRALLTSNSAESQSR